MSARYTLAVYLNPRMLGILSGLPDDLKESILGESPKLPTFIIGVPAICLWYSLQEKTKWMNTIFIVAIFFSSFSYSDIFTPWLRTQIMMPYALKALGCFIVWVVIAVQIFTKQFLKVRVEKLSS